MKNHYLTPHWPAPNNISAYTTLRFNGHSKPPFDSFNLSTREPADSQDALANRQQLKSELELTTDPFWISQTHGTHAIQADACTEINPEADASYTSRPNTVCTVLTADCLPLLVCSKAGTEVAAIHAGWKGLQAGVIESTFSKLTTPPGECLVWLGPAIGPNAFEVGDDVRQLFLTVDAEAEQAFKMIRPNKWLCDIYTIARQRLAKIGVKNVYGGEHCTYSEADRFYSFRRDKGLTGRMASLIWIHS
ncbi:MAG: multi-copper polyphenol oxidoreductase, laccase [Gammaproteobacteria bacterium]|jgi:YfiH family protein|nr:multi-copper polyphenol oxidoreductase, laccase [Gammaproteobacteria bacterium]